MPHASQSIIAPAVPPEYKGVPLPPTVFRPPSSTDNYFPDELTMSTHNTKLQIPPHHAPEPLPADTRRPLHSMFRLQNRRVRSEMNPTYESGSSTEKICTGEFFLSDRQRHMGLLLRLSRDKRSPVAGIYFILASLGKLVFGLGASLAVKGHFASDLTTLVAGCVCIGIGFVCVVLVALGFSAALHQINRAFAIFLKCVSIGGGIIIAVGYASNRLSLFAGLEYFVSTKRPLLDVRLSFLPLMLGSSMLVFSISNFASYTELVRGRMSGLPLRHRPVIALCLLSVAIGILFAGWITGEHADWPAGFNSAVLTIATTTLYAGAALFWSHHVHREAEWACYCMALEEYHGYSGRSASPILTQIIQSAPELPPLTSDAVTGDFSF